MATKKKVTEEKAVEAPAKGKGKAEAKMIGVADLAAKYDVDARQLRQLLRSKGHKAPEANTPAGTFGPKAKYQWAEGSKELAAVCKDIEEALADSDDSDDDAE